MSLAGRSLSVLAAAALALFLLYLSIPRGVAALIMLPADHVVSWVKQGRAADLRPEDLENLIESRQQASYWIEDGEVFANLAIAQLVAAGTDSTSEDDPQHVRGRLLAEASAALQRGLAAAPVNPHAWAQLGYTKLLAGDDPVGAVPFLKMSIYTGPYEPRLVFPRVKLLLELWNLLSDAERDLVYPQIRFAWNVSRPKLVDLAMTMDKQRINVMRLALARTPKFLASFERRLRWARRKAQEQGGS